MTQKQIQKMLIAQMSPKDYAQHLVTKHFEQPGIQYGCLTQLWGKESAWNYKAKSRSQDYGIPQRHMSDNTAEEIAKFMKHPHRQIDWGINYIISRYDTPCNALKSWLSRADENGKGGWY